MVKWVLHLILFVDDKTMQDVIVPLPNHKISFSYSRSVLHAVLLRIEDVRLPQLFYCSVSLTVRVNPLALMNSRMNVFSDTSGTGSET